MGYIKQHKRKKSLNRGGANKSINKKLMAKKNKNLTLTRVIKEYSKSDEKLDRRNINVFDFNAEYGNITKSIKEYRRDSKQVTYKEETGFTFDNNVIDTSHEMAVSQIMEYWNENKTIVPISSVSQIINNEEFIEFVLKNKVDFISHDEPILSQSICNMMHYINKNYFGNTRLGEYRIEKAIEFAKNIGPIIDKLEEDDHKSLQAKADELNLKNIKTLRGKKWSSMTVKRTWERWQKLKAEEENKDTFPSKTPKPE